MNPSSQPIYQIGGDQQYTPTAGALMSQVSDSSIGGYGNPTQQVPAPQSHDSGNWFTHLLPTIGGIGGSILGGIVTGGLGGEFVGGGAGGALGQGIENLLEGKNPVDSNDLTSGIANAAGSGIGGLVGKGLGLAGGLAKGAAENITKGAADDAAQAATKNSVTDLATEYGDVPNKLQELYGGKNTTDFVKGLGFEPNADNLVNVGRTANDHLNDVLNGTLADSGPVDLSNYNQIIKDALSKDNRGNTIGSYEKVAIGPGRVGYDNNPASKTLQQLENLGAGIAKTNADPNEVRNLTTQLYKAAQDAKPTSVNMNTGAIDPEQQTIYHAISDVRDAVKNALYNRPEVNDALTTMEGNLQAGDTLGSQALADHLNGIVSGAGKNGSTTAAQDVLDAIKHNINVENFGQEGQKVKQIITSTAGKGRILAENGIPAGQATPVDPTTGSPLNLAQDFSQAKGPLGKGFVLTKHVATNPGVLNTLARIGKLSDSLGSVGGKALPGAADIAGIGLANAPNMGGGPVPVGTNGTIGGTMQDQPQGSQNLLANILAHYNDMGSLNPYLLSSTAPVVQALAPTVQKQQMAAGALGQLPSEFANAGGAQGTSGIFSHISALIPGTAAYNFEHQKQADAQALANAMGISVGQAQSFLPGLMQNSQTAGLNQGILSQLTGQLGG